MRPLFLIFISSITMAAQAPAKQPSVEEGVILDLCNQYRTDQQRIRFRLEDMVRRNELPTDKATKDAWLLANTGHRQALAPVVMNPLLNAAARNLLISKVLPERLKAIDAIAPLKAVNYTPDSSGLVVIGRDASSASVAFLTALMAVTSEKEIRPGYVMPSFTAAQVFQPQWREVGIAVIVEGAKFHTAMVFGLGSAQRYVGGVVFADANHNGRFDAGEGRPGIEVKSGGIGMTTGPAGAWWMFLDNGDPVTVEFNGEGFTANRPVVRGTANLCIDWRMPLAADNKSADKLMADVKRAVGPDPQRKALAALIAGTRVAILDEAHQTKVTALVAGMMGEYTTAVKRCMDALTDTHQNFLARFDRIKATCRGSFVAMFKEIEDIHRLGQLVAAFQAAPPDQQTKQGPDLLRDITKAREASGEPLLDQQYVFMLEGVASVLNTLEPVAKP